MGAVINGTTMRGAECATPPPANEKSLIVKTLILATRNGAEMDRRYRALPSNSVRGEGAIEALGRYMEQQGFTAPEAGWNNLFRDPDLIKWGQDQTQHRAVAWSTLYEQLREGRQHLGMSSEVSEDEADFERYFPLYAAGYCFGTHEEAVKWRDSRTESNGKAQRSQNIRAAIIFGTAAAAITWAWRSGTERSA